MILSHAFISIIERGNDIMKIKKIALSLAVSVALVACAPKSDLVEFEYKITNVDASGYYGSSLSDDTNIFFTDENIHEKVYVGDTITAVFKMSNTVDGIVDIYKK